jgi:hypothetical protein
MLKNNRSHNASWNRKVNIYRRKSGTAVFQIILEFGLYCLFGIGFYGIAGRAAVCAVKVNIQSC